MKEIPAEVREALELLTADQVAQLLQVHKEWLYDQCNEGKFPHVRLGRNIRFRPLEVQRYLAGEWQAAS